jgi:hypothetical protein
MTEELSDFQDHVNEFLKRWQERKQASNRSLNRVDMGDSFWTEPSLEGKYTKVISKIVTHKGEFRTVAAFIDNETGDIFRAATWEQPQPTKRVHGNINNDDYGMSAVNPEGEGIRVA